MTKVLSLRREVFLMESLRITENQIKSPPGTMDVLRWDLLLKMFQWRRYNKRIFSGKSRLTTVRIVRQIPHVRITKRNSRESLRHTTVRNVPNLHISL